MIKDYLPARYLAEFEAMNFCDQVSAQQLFEYDSDDFMSWTEEDRAINAIRVVRTTKKRLEAITNA